MTDVVFVGGPRHGQKCKYMGAGRYNALLPGGNGFVEVVEYRLEKFFWMLPDSPHRAIYCLVTGQMPDWIQVLDALAIAYGFGNEEP